MKTNTYYKREGIVITPVGDVSIVSPNFEDESQGAYICMLDEVGTFIFKHIDGTNTTNDIIKKIVEHYNVDFSDVGDDAVNLLNDLEKNKLIIKKE